MSFALKFVRLADGTVLPLAIPLDLAAGEKVTYGIRPQHMGLGDAGIPAEVVLIEPTGEDREVLMKIGGGHDVSVVVRDQRALNPGDSAFLVPDVGKVLLFNPGDGSRLT